MAEDAGDGEWIREEGEDAYFSAPVEAAQREGASSRSGRYSWQEWAIEVGSAGL